MRPTEWEELLAAERRRLRPARIARWLLPLGLLPFALLAALAALAWSTL